MTRSTHRGGFGQPGPPCVVYYAREHGFDVGSTVKYGAMFARALRERGCRLREIVGPPATLGKAIKRERPAFVICGGDHWEQWMAAKAAGVPYILDEHDICTLRGAQRGQKREREKVENAAAIVFTSEEHVAYYQKRGYRLPPHRVVHLRPTATALDFRPLPKLPGKHLVYAGGLVDYANRKGKYGYRAYHDIFRVLIEAGWTVHLYPCYLANNRMVAEYAALGCVIEKSVPQVALARECSRYAVGLQGYANSGCDRQAFDYCMTCRPNKLWESLAAGIPTVGINAGRGGRLYAGKWGVVARSIETLPAAAERAARMTIDEGLRRSQVIDSDIAAFRELTDVALAAEHVIAPRATRPDPVRLAKRVSYHGSLHEPGSYIPLALARAMYRDGVLTDDRLA